MALKPLSLRAYAAHRKGLGLAGGSLQAVQRAIAAGRIRDSVVVVGGVRQIADPEAADREWLSNTDLSKAPGWVKELGDIGDDDLDEGDGASLSAASAREKHWKAELAELTFKQKSGELVNAAEMRAVIADKFSTIRTKLLGVPNKVKQQHQDLPLPVLAAIDEAIRHALEELTMPATSTESEPGA